ncbi:MAG TPA: SpoIIE family protein phosphatase [Mycobacterium sp.]|uniref:SpoIIE family protein phosphatase n=1 Tax=Mycobacterium sp. TaxID=1785 RepID=UPI002C6D638D|nr:SpoIIE family protein phosphatase [Mycobacterium sp.]HXO80630.1 SpoIIE family protein phosphatase [Mycobacterium sp.]
MAEHGWLGPIEWAATSRPLPGQTVCGDRSIAVDVNGTGALIGVLDGLGHGELAAEAADCGVQILGDTRGEALDTLVQSCHRGLSSTRGVAMTLVHIDFQKDTLSWVGIGNVAADLVAKHPGGVEVRSSVRLAGGIVGYRVPEVVVSQDFPIRPGDLLVITSDGIDENHLDGIDFAAPALTIAEQILDSHAKDNDDALVLTARHRGASG